MAPTRPLALAALALSLALSAPSTVAAGVAAVRGAGKGVRVVPGKSVRTWGAGATPGCVTSHSWDFLMLVSQWAITECMDVYSCTASNLYFTLHGLWPTNNDGSYPCTCTSEAFDPNAISSIMGSMNKYWPSLNGPNADFWSHEWTKHGTCAENVLATELDFFSTTLGLLGKYNTTQALAAASIYPSNTKGFSISAFHAATSKAWGAQAVVNCDNSGNIEEVAVCMDPNFNVIACPSTTTDDCSASTLYLPSSVH